MSLQQQLDEFKAAFIEKLPAEVLNTMTESTRRLISSGIEQQALKDGDQLPDATLTNQVGKSVSIAQLHTESPLVISFYRGGWCPYCNMELRELQKALPEIQAQGANLVAITPELPDASLNTVEKNELNFTVLTDEGSEFAKSLGLVFTLPEELRPIYDSFGIDLEKHNGKGQFDLPLAATFVVTQDGRVASAFVDADYTKRLEPQAIVDTLANLQN